MTRIHQHSNIHRQRDKREAVHNQLMSIQQKPLEVSHPEDASEKEADDIAGKVVNGGSASVNGSTNNTINRKGEGVSEVTSEFQSGVESSKGSGQSLDDFTRSEMESKMGTDFSDVKIHTGSQANNMSESINAKAFTHGQDVYFKNGNYNPSSNEGKELLAHELVHTQQQSSGQVQPKIQRQLLYPVEPKQATVSDIFLYGGLIHDDEIRRASAIVDSKTTIRTIATEILPWFNGVLPAEGSKNVPPTFTVDELAKAIVVFNQYYFPVTSNPATSMTNFKVGFRIPLPVAIDFSENWLINPYQVKSLVNGFDETWLPYLDQKPKAAVIPTDAAADADKFLKDEPDLTGRAIHLGSLILSNPTEALPLVRALFDRDDVGHELAIEIMNFMVNHQVGMLASLGQGYEIIGILYSAVNEAPDNLPEAEQKEKARAIYMLGTFAVPAITINPTSVYPRGTGGDEYSDVTITGLPPGFTATPTIRAVPFSGGHDHDGNRPTGALTPATVNTGRTNQAKFRYRSSIVGGEEIISLTVGSKVVDVHIDVMVPGFVELPASPNYQLIGATTTHTIAHNHWGRPETVQALQDIAAEFEAYKVANNHPNWPIIEYNDMSLPRGGVFDISTPWHGPHEEHRTGRSCDFRNTTFNATQQAVLREIMDRYTSSILVHVAPDPPHWHLRFDD